MPAEFVERAKALIEARDFQEAAKVCRLGLLVEPTLIEGRLLLGMALMALGRYDDVLAEMRAVLEQESDQPLAMLLKGEALYCKGEHHQALSVLEGARSQGAVADDVERLLGKVRGAAAAGHSSSDTLRESTDTKEYPASRNREDPPTEPRVEPPTEPIAESDASEDGDRTHVDPNPPADDAAAELPGSDEATGTSEDAPTSVEVAEAATDSWVALEDKETQLVTDESEDSSSVTFLHEDKVDEQKKTEPALKPFEAAKPLEDSGAPTETRPTEPARPISEPPATFPPRPVRAESQPLAVPWLAAQPVWQDPQSRRRGSLGALFPKPSGKAWLLLGSVLFLSVAIGLALRRMLAHREVTFRMQAAREALSGANFGGYAQALRLYGQVLAIYPHDPAALALRARVAGALPYEFGEPPPSPLENLIRDAQGGAPSATLDAAQIYMRLGSGQAEAAEKEAREAASHSPGDALFAYLVGRAQLDRGNARAACDSFRDALKWDPRSVLALRGLGMGLGDQGQIAQALLAYQGALAQNPNHVGTLLSLAELRIEMERDLSEARRDLLRVTTELGPESARAEQGLAHVALGLLDANQGDLDQAKQALARARTFTFERSVQAHVALASLCLQIGDATCAASAAERARALAPDALGPQLAVVAVELDRGEWEAARKQLDSLPGREATLAALVLRCRLELELGNLGAAQRDQTEAEHRAPDRTDVAVLKARILLGRGDSKKALAILQPLRQRWPRRADIAQALGIALASMQDPRAPEVLEQAVASSPATLGARRVLAGLLRRQNRMKEAAELLGQVYAQTPLESLRFEYAELLYEVGDLAQASALLDGIETPPSDAKRLLLLVRIQAAAGERGKCMRLADLATQRGASRLEVAKALAEVALVTGDAAEALSQARRATKISESDAKARALFAQALALGGAVDDAQSTLRKSLEHANHRSDLLLAWGKIQVDQDQPDLALLEKALQAARDENRPPRLVSEVYTLLGRAYYYQGKVRLALRSMNEALGLNPHNPLAAYFRGLMLYESDRVADALADIRTATQAKPALPPAYFHLGKLLEKSGDRPGAKRAFGDYLRIAGPAGEYVDDAKRALSALN